MGDMRDIEIEITLRGGKSYQGILPSDSPILSGLFASLASNHDPDPNAPVTLLQFPLDGGEAACSFMSTSLVSIVTRPPVLVNPVHQAEPQQMVAAPQFHAPYVMIEDFLTPEENRQVLEYALGNEDKFEGSTVLTHDGKIDEMGYRRSRVLFAIRESKWSDLFSQRIKLHLAHIAPTLGLDAQRLVPKEIQLTASNDGDFFKVHADSGDGSEDVSQRVLTFVYYFHKSPKPYAGGDLLLYQQHPGERSPGIPPLAVPPRNNCLVAFASSTMHEVDIVKCPSGEFGDSRFTINGWLRYE